MEGNIISPKLQGLTPVDTVYETAKPSQNIYANSIHLVGFEFDGTACFRKGTVKGPNAIRFDAPNIETYSPYMDSDLEDFDNLYDLGNLDLGESSDEEKQWKLGSEHFSNLIAADLLSENNSALFTLGGEHSISYAPIVKYLEAYPDLVLIHLDAHADLRDGYEGYHFSHASIIRRTLDHFGPNHQLIQYGIRSGTKEEYAWMREHKTNCQSFDDFIERVIAIDPNRPIYLTLDLDYFDPSFLPGTGTPEPGGETFHSFIKMNKILRNKRFVGCDVVELSPDIDASGNSAVFATKVVRELILTLNLSMNKN